VELVQPEIFIGLSWGPISRKCMFFVGPPQKKHGFRIQEPHVSPFLENNIYYYLYIYIYMYTLDVFGDLLIKPKLFQQKANKNDLLDQMSSISERI
jgi:hypothetical protein